MIRVAFSESKSGPEALLGEAELVFEGEEFGALDGMKLVGFSIWRGRDGNGSYVTFPSRAFGTGSERRFFDYLRPASGPFNRDSGKAVKEAILRAYKKRNPGADPEVTKRAPKRTDDEDVPF
jgi:DNA-binding cell septation regulator SpoVG